MHIVVLMPERNPTYSTQAFRLMKNVTSIFYILPKLFIRLVS
jgi:hypothetical protein